VIFRGFEVSGFFGFHGLKITGLKTVKYQKYRLLNFHGFQVLRNKDFEVSRYLFLSSVRGLKISGF
jgi:hypothetical protein